MNDVRREGFWHSAWATKALSAACRVTSVEQLHRPARGFGSILATLNHVVSDARYVAILTGVWPEWMMQESGADDLDRAPRRSDGPSPAHGLRPNTWSPSSGSHPT